MVPIGLYIHIPFCLKKCFYCDFNSIPVAADIEKQKLTKRYMNALCMEIEKYMVFPAWKNYQVKSIFFGGGTPSLVGAEEIGETLRYCRKTFKIADDAEVTIEANPGTVSPDFLKSYLKAGINRISFGCQSFNDYELKKIGRVHSAEDIYRSLDMAKEAGFENVGIDLIFGIPGQNLESFKSSLNRAIFLKPHHISLYNLTIEENTHFYQLIRNGELKLPDEDEQVWMYEYGIETISKKGYEHYEISNFAVKGKRCRHNENYWRGGEYLGFGAGAHSFIRVQSENVAAEPCSALRNGKNSKGAKVIGKRWWNVKDVEMYCKGVEDSVQRSAFSLEGQIPSNPPLLKGGWGDSKERAMNSEQRATDKVHSVVEGEEFLDREKLISEAMMLGLRLIDGIDTEEFFNIHGVSIEDKYSKEIKELIKNNLLKLKNIKLKLTHRGILFSNEVFLKFMV